MVCSQRQLSKTTPIGLEVVAGIVGVCGGLESPKKQLGTYPTYVAAHSVMLVVPLHQAT